MARASNELDALKAICDLLVDKGGFRGASVGFHQTGQHMGSVSNHCFLLNAEGQQLGALVLSSADPAAFTPELVEKMTVWSESLALLLAAVRRRALHGRAASEADTYVEDLKRTERALRRSKAFLDKAQRLSLTGSFIWTVSTDTVEWSDETFRILGYDRTTTKPSIERLFQRIHPEDLSRAKEIFTHATCAIEDFEAELRVLLPEGATKHVRVVLQAIGCPATGEFVGAIMDITAAKELTQAIAFRDQVMAVLGHDLRNPLGAVSGIAGLALLDQRLANEVREHFVQIQHSASRMSELIGTLLDFTQTRFSGRLPIAPAPTDLGVVCGRVIEEISAAHRDRTIELETRGDAHGVWDPARIAQVVSNLVVNAITHGDHASPVRLSIEGDQGDVVLKVRNRGRAIAKESIPSLFEPFRRGLPEDASRPRGLGLGLHIAKQIVSAHGGTISVQSAPELGTTFSVDLPRSAQPS